jgi:hypothetical protein
MNPQQYPPQPGQDPQGYPPQGPPAGYPPQAYPSGGAVPPYQQPPAPMQPGQSPAPPAPGYNPYDFATNPSYSPQPVKKGPNKGVIMAILILGILTVLIVALTVVPTGDNNNNNPPQSQNNNNSNQGNKDIVDRSDGSLDLGSRITLNQSLKAQKLQAKIKQQVNLSSGFSFMANKVEDYTSPNPTTKPADGKKFIVVTTVVGNRLNSGNLSVSYLDFRLRDADNNAIPGHVTTNEILDNQLSSPNEIKPGEQITGKVIFEVNATDTSWVFKHSETYQKTTDNTTFEVEGEIVLGDTIVPDDSEPATTPSTN